MSSLSQGIPVSRETRYHFLAYMEDAFLLRAIPVAKVSERHKQEKNAERQRRYRARIRQKLERLKLLESPRP